MVTVIATIRAKSGCETETEQLLRGLLQPTHAERGCVKYALHRRTDQPGVFYFIEAWASPEDLRRHLNSAHIATAMARKAELLASIDIAQLDLLGDGSSAKGALWNF